MVWRSIRSPRSVGFIEAGTVAIPNPAANALDHSVPLDQALINRAGFNNQGARAFAKRVELDRPDCVLGVSIGKSKVVAFEDAVTDYLQSFEAVYPVADYIAVNVSSPNTPRLRELQKTDQLEVLLRALQECNEKLAAQPDGRGVLPLLVKLSPDLDVNELESIVAVARRNKMPVLPPLMSIEIVENKCETVAVVRRRLEGAPCDADPWKWCDALQYD